ncbi:hypothetical protein PIB30_097959, partial [Stylosanthes scabra]|nr:hypothetical protein [Stylosanthes scabra]
THRRGKSTHMRGSPNLAKMHSRLYVLLGMALPSQVKQSINVTPTPRRALGSLGMASTFQPTSEPTHRRRRPSLCVEASESSPKHTRVHA